MRSGVAALAVGNLTGAVLGFFIAVLIGRGTGEEGLGAVATAMAWIFPLSLVVDAGLSAPLIREVAAIPTRMAGIMRATLQARGLLGMAVCGFLILAAPLLTSTLSASDALRVGAPLVLLNPLVGTYTAAFRARQRLWRAAALNVGMLILQVIFTILALSAGWGVAGVMLANVASSGVQLAVAWGWYRRDSTPDDRLTPPVWGRVRAAWPFALASVLAAIQMRMGVALTEAWAGAAAAGLYAAAYRFIEAGRLIPQAGFDALLPALSAVRDKSQHFKATAWGAGRFVTLYGAMFALGCFALGGWVIPLLFGDSFAPSGNLLRVMGVGLLPMSLKYWAGVVWIARGEERRVTRLNAVALAAQLVLSAILIPTYGAAGATLALILGESIGAGLMLMNRPFSPP